MNTNILLQKEHSYKGLHKDHEGQLIIMNLYSASHHVNPNINPKPKKAIISISYLCGFCFDFQLQVGPRSVTMSLSLANHKVAIVLPPGH